MTPTVLTCCLLISAIAVADPAQNAAIKDVMKEKGAAFIIIDCASGEITDIDPGASGKRLPPCSTFKIWNSLIVIEEGLQTGAEEPFHQWDGAASKSIIGPAPQTIDENPGYSQRHTLRQDR